MSCALFKGRGVMGHAVCAAAALNLKSAGQAVKAFEVEVAVEGVDACSRAVVVLVDVVKLWQMIHQRYD
jgi:hypothetical protein